jgi:hypothetical protein
MSQTAKPGNQAANRLVIRFATARLKDAADRLQNRTKRIGASNARSKITALAITIDDPYATQNSRVVRRQRKRLAASTLQ